jgi:hypothetical protein
MNKIVQGSIGKRGNFMAKRVTCISCGNFRPHHERGCCLPCWNRRRTCAGPQGVPVPCSHCVVGQGWTNHRRLCDTCFQDNDIRQMYGTKDGLVESDRIKNTVLPASPTISEPGSEENIQILAARYKRGESLHHPNDKKIQHAPPPFRLIVGGGGHG